MVEQAVHIQGRPCRHGHGTLRYAKNGTCVICAQAHTARRRAAKLDEIRAQQRAAYPLRREKNIERCRARYHAHKEQEAIRAAAYRAANRTELLESKRAYYRANVEATKAKIREWHARNPDAAREYSAARRARKVNAEGRYTKKDVQRIHALQRGKCAVCRCELNRYHVDHIVPLAAGGSNWPNNLQILCPPCNFSKSARNPVDFMQSRGMLL